LPGRYFMVVSSTATGAAATGDYTLKTQFTPNALNPYDPDTLLSRLQVGTDPRSIVEADFNRDGILDLATANQRSHNVSILLGIGDGTFQPQKQIDVSGNPDALVAGDFNRDGRLDLLSLDGTTNQVTRL